MSGSFLVYGATGYTGRLIAEHAVARGLRPVLVGRSAEALRPLAERLGLEWRAAGLADPAALRAALSGVKAVLHAAGPFSATAAPMAEACLAEGVHYLDITGEIDVFEALARRGAAAEAAGVMLLPGAGFDVVPSDCLAAHLKARLPGAIRLHLSIGGFGGDTSALSRGTAKTMIEGVGHGTRARRAGRIVALDRPPRGQADFGKGPRPTIGLGWGDVATAWHATGIPDITVFFQASPSLARAAAPPAWLRRLLASAPAQSLLKHAVERRLPPGPTPANRARSRSVFLAEAWDSDGGYAASRLTTAEGYTLTAWTAVELALRAASGQIRPGFQTPSTAYGADLILAFEGSARVDL